MCVCVCVCVCVQTRARWNDSWPNHYGSVIPLSYVSLLQSRSLEKSMESNSVNVACAHERLFTYMSEPCCQRAAIDLSEQGRDTLIINAISCYFPPAVLFMCRCNIKSKNLSYRTSLALVHCAVTHCVWSAVGVRSIPVRNLLMSYCCLLLVFVGFLCCILFCFLYLFVWFFFKDFFWWGEGGGGIGCVWVCSTVNKMSFIK